MVKPRKMSGEVTHYAFADLLNTASSLFKTSSEVRAAKLPGAGNCRTAAALFCALAIEAHLNHVGELTLPYWDIVEPKLQWESKLRLIARHLSFDVPFGASPFSQLKGLFQFRNYLAHGKTVTFEEETTEDDVFGSPAILKRYETDAAVEAVLRDTRAIIALIQEKAGLPEHQIATMASGAYWEVGDDAEEPPRSPNA